MVSPFNWFRRKRQSQAKIRRDMVNGEDSSGSVPPWEAPWEAMFGRHESICILWQNFDVAPSACDAADRNSLKRVRDIKCHGGDVTHPIASTKTALHLKAQSSPEKQRQTSYLERATNEPAMPLSHERSLAGTDRYYHQSHANRSNNFHGHNNLLSYPDPRNGAAGGVNQKRYRVTISCPEKSKTDQWVVLLPESFEKLLELGTKTFGISPVWIVSKDHRGRIGGIDVINNEEHLLFLSFYPHSAEHVKLIDSLIADANSGANGKRYGKRYRVTISCPEKSNTEPWLVLLPGSFKELLELGAKKFGITPVSIISKKHRSRIDNIDVIRNDDHLLFVCAHPKERFLNGHKCKNYFLGTETKESLAYE